MMIYTPSNSWESLLGVMLAYGMFAFIMYICDQ